MKPYEGLAAVYDLLYERSRGVDFGAEARDLAEQIRRRAPHARTLLDVACGTGAHLEHLRRQFRAEGLDISPKMLKVARRRNPGLRLHLGDMATFHLPRRFDAVICLFSAIAYANTPTRLRRAIRNLAGHVAPGGVLVVDAWLAPGVFTAGHVSVDEASDGITTVVRVNRSSLRGRISIMEWHFLVATARRIDHFTERHEVGLFEPDEYIEAMEAAGLSVDVDPAACHGRGRYFGRAAAGGPLPRFLQKSRAAVTGGAGFLQK